MCNIEKHINKFYKKYTEWKDCNKTSGLKRFSENKLKLPIQQKKIQLNI